VSEPLSTPQPAARPEQHAPTERSLAVAAAAALAAAVAGGVLWGFVVEWSDYELGILAWAIGFASGTAVVLASGRRGPPLQAIAIAAALLGILLGKYLSFALVVQEDADGLGIEVGLFSGEMRDLFRDSVSDVFGWLDLLWIGFAVFSAWRIPRPEAPLPRDA
jgi:hypothetical protein